MRGFSKIGIFLAAFLLCSCNANSPENKFHLAEKLLEDKKYDAAVNEFDKISDKSPNSVLGLEAQLKVAQIQQLYLGRSKEAIEAYRVYLRRSNDPQKKREVEKSLADLLFSSLESYDEAVAAYSKLIEVDPNSQDSQEYLYKIGRAFFLKSKFNDAIKIFEQLKTKFPEGKYHWRAEIDLANSYAAKSNCNEAIKRYDSIAASGPKEFQVLAKFGKAVCFEEQDELDDAYELFSSIRSDYPAPTVVDLKLQKIKKRKILRRR